MIIDKISQPAKEACVPRVGKGLGIKPTPKLSCGLSLGILIVYMATTSLVALAGVSVPPMVFNINFQLLGIIAGGLFIFGVLSGLLPSFILERRETARLLRRV